MSNGVPLFATQFHQLPPHLQPFGRAPAIRQANQIVGIFDKLTSQFRAVEEVTHLAVVKARAIVKIGRSDEALCVADNVFGVQFGVMVVPAKTYIVELAGLENSYLRMIYHFDPRVTLHQLHNAVTVLLLAAPLFLHILGHQQSRCQVDVYDGLRGKIICRQNRVGHNVDRAVRVLFDPVDQSLCTIYGDVTIAVLVISGE